MQESSSSEDLKGPKDQNPTLLGRIASDASNKHSQQQFHHIQKNINNHVLRAANTGMWHIILRMSNSPWLQDAHNRNLIQSLLQKNGLYSRFKKTHSPDNKWVRLYISWSPTQHDETDRSDADDEQDEKEKEAKSTDEQPSSQHKTEDSAEHEAPVAKERISHKKNDHKKKKEEEKKLKKEQKKLKKKLQKEEKKLKKHPSSARASKIERRQKQQQQQQQHETPSWIFGSLSSDEEKPSTSSAPLLRIPKEDLHLFDNEKKQIQISYEPGDSSREINENATVQHQPVFFQPRTHPHASTEDLHSASYVSDVSDVSDSSEDEHKKKNEKEIQKEKEKGTQGFK